MKSTVSFYPDAIPAIRWRVADYVEISRPRIAFLILFTVAAGFCFASDDPTDPARLAHAVLGTALLVAGASAFNQVFERDTDGMMARTADRPIPSGRLQPFEVLLFGAILALGGLAYIAITLHQSKAIFTAAVAFAVYVFVYTPLKRKTTLNTLVGALAGALLPVIGWTAARNSFDAPAVVLFAIVFFWQLPHFLAIAWIYRGDYANAGLRMLPAKDRNGKWTAWQMVGHCVALLMVSAIPWMAGWVGGAYLVGAAGLGAGFLGCALSFLHTRSIARARRVLRMSLIYLPLLLAILLLDKALGSWTAVP